jgi:hypothetical protein
VEYIAISEAAKEIKLIYNLMKGLHVEVILPIIVKDDNIGEIFMSENDVRTRHVDTCYHFIQECIKDGFTKINLFVQRKMTRRIYKKCRSGNL